MTGPLRERLQTGISNLDTLLHGGLPKGSTTLVKGRPGTGKTILSQQICCHCGSDALPALYFSTLSEPVAKTLLHLSEFTFFRTDDFDTRVKLIDLGVLLRAEGLQATLASIIEHVRNAQPTIVVIDSIKAFDDLAKSTEEQRMFGYELGVTMMAWGCTTLLVGVYGHDDQVTNPLFSIYDGIIRLSERESGGQLQRYLQVLKMRGTQHEREEHRFEISQDGITLFPRTGPVLGSGIPDANVVHTQDDVHSAWAEECTRLMAQRSKLEADVSRLEAEKLALDGVNAQLEKNVVRLEAENAGLQKAIKQTAAK
jgi:circadian clock protein KaiC